MECSHNKTRCGNDLCTWWHDTGEINQNAPVQPGNVRQSHRYSVQVRVAGRNEFLDSFVYESIPRNGNGRMLAPSDSPNSTIEPSIGMNMAWTQFEYGQDADLKIATTDNSSLGRPEDVIIRPTSIKYFISSSNDGEIVVRIPYDPHGRKFSIEFNNDLYTFRSDGKNYVSSGGYVMGIEPTNALVIFASPFLPSDMVPAMNSHNTQTMTPGPINNGDWGSKPILYSPPGVYYLNEDTKGVSRKFGSNHMILYPQTYWVHFAPGAYVKGAIEYTTHGSKFYATGYGVLSGENYIHQANVDESYTAVKIDGLVDSGWRSNSHP